MNCRISIHDAILSALYSASSICYYKRCAYIITLINKQILFYCSVQLGHIMTTEGLLPVQLISFIHS